MNERTTLLMSADAQLAPALAAARAAADPVLALSALRSSASAEADFAVSIYVWHAISAELDVAEAQAAAGSAPQRKTSRWRRFTRWLLPAQTKEVPMGSTPIASAR